MEWIIPEDATNKFLVELENSFPRGQKTNIMDIGPPCEQLVGNGIRLAASFRLLLLGKARRVRACLANGAPDWFGCRWARGTCGRC